MREQKFKIFKFVIQDFAKDDTNLNQIYTKYKISDDTTKKELELLKTGIEEIKKEIRKKTDEKNNAKIENYRSLIP